MQQSEKEPVQQSDGCMVGRDDRLKSLQGFLVFLATREIKFTYFLEGYKMFFSVLNFREDINRFYFLVIFGLFTPDKGLSLVFDTSDKTTKILIHIWTSSK